MRHQNAVFADSNRFAGVELRVCSVDQHGDVTRKPEQPLKLVPVEPGDVSGWTEPTVVLDREMTQQLMNDLWRLGFRPHNVENAASQVVAIQAHLQDMRNIAFAQLNIPKDGK